MVTSKILGRQRIPSRKAAAAMTSLNTSTNENVTAATSTSTAVPIPPQTPTPKPKRATSVQSQAVAQSTTSKDVRHINNKVNQAAMSSQSSVAAEPAVTKVVAKQIKTTWTTEEIEEMCYLLLGIKDAGGGADNGFKASEWQEIGDTLSKPSRACETKFARIKKEFYDIRFIRECSGFGWDDEICIAEAEPQVWDDLLCKKPECAKWQSTLFPCYSTVQAILGNTMSKGKYKFSANISDSSKDEDGASAEGERHLTPQSNGDNPIVLDDSENDNIDPTLQKKRSKKRSIDISPSSERTARKRSGISVMNQMVVGLERMAEAMAQPYIVDIAQEKVNTTLEGQVIELIQDEQCLSSEGKL